MALIPITRAIRGVASVPVLIGLLEEAAKGRDADAFSGTLTSAIQASLQDLTGFYAPAHEPEKWRKFWEEQQDTFQLAPERKQGEAKKGDTVSRGFFGIPVTGSRIVFVLDVSGSMREPASGATVSRGPGGAPFGQLHLQARQGQAGADAGGRRAYRGRRVQRDLLREPRAALAKATGLGQ
jgi:hypothetical protein